MHVFNFSCDGRVDLENHLEAAKGSITFKKIGLSFLLYLRYGKKYSIDCNCWGIFFLKSHLNVAFPNDQAMQAKLQNIITLRNSSPHISADIILT
jgi:hypothetical protein